MRTAFLRTLLAAMVLAGVSPRGQQASIDPERVLAERFHFTPQELSKAREGTPVVKVQADRGELAVTGAIRLPGRKERLADWVKNIEHFRRSAALGVAHVIPSPPGPDAFAGVTLDPSDLAELQRCRPDACALRVAPGVLPQLQAAGTANDAFRRMLLDYTTAYLKDGNGSAIGPLIRRASTLTALAPELVSFFERYPASTLPSSEQMIYWSVMPIDAASLVGVHHLVVYRPRSGEIWIADNNVYASRYFDAAMLVIGLYDAPGGAGFYACAGARLTSARLAGAAATVLRRQIQRSAADSVRTYLEWIRDSLSLPS